MTKRYEYRVEYLKLTTGKGTLEQIVEALNRFGAERLAFQPDVRRGRPALVDLMERGSEPAPGAGNCRLMSPVIQALLESLGVTLVAACGVALGWWFSNRRKPLWLIGYIAPFLLLILVSLPRRLPRLELVIPFRWIMAGRREFVVMALVCTTLLVTLLPKLSRRGERAMVGLFAAFATLYIAVLPFLMPALDYGRQSRLNTRFDDNGVCLQSNSYNCGPAAAVTALRRLGVPAEEGELAVRAHTSFVAGTSPDSLADAIRRLYGLPSLCGPFLLPRRTPREGAPCGTREAQHVHGSLRHRTCRQGGGRGYRRSLYRPQYVEPR